MRFGVHLPLMDFGGNPFSVAHLREYVRRARDLGASFVAANDHMVFSVPWLDGPTALASVVSDTEPMTLATTVGLPVIRGPVAFAKSMAAIDRISGGRLIVAVGPGSSARDYEAVGLRFDERWQRLDEAIRFLRSAWDPASEPFEGRYYSTRGLELRPAPARNGPQIWVGSWGSPAGLRRTAQLADGWLASAYNTTPDAFGEAQLMLADMLSTLGRPADGFPNGLATMWFHISDDPNEVDTIFHERLLPAVNRPEEVLRDRLPVGPAEEFARRLRAFRDAGLQQVLIWPVHDEIRQLERFREEVWPLVEPD